ncbi:MAG: 16S rRNA (uracil(1498)-N(3))-methyltransferase [Acidocella sp.]|nr:16S rRNA (uracil(1498)-N(3))-methyltransferase [Acidocella sp.]
MSASSIRLFVESPLHEGAIVSPSDAQAHYLMNVMRAAPGDILRLFNGEAGEWTAEIVNLSRKRVALKVIAQQCEMRPEPDCWLCFALLKRQKTDLVVEKATELGVSVIQPMITARTQADHVNMARLRTISVEAAEQCGRLVVPRLRAPMPLGQLMTTWPDRILYVADERRDAPLLRPDASQFGPRALMIGPEGGFTDQELEAVTRTPLVTRVSLGQRILRAETAVIAGLALLLSGDP